MNGAPDDGNDRYILPAIEGWMVGEPQPNPLRDKSFQFALEIIELNRALVKEHEYVISKQLMRSGTAVGAIVEEAIGAESRKDFLHKMSIAHKEAREVHYWLRLLDASILLPDVDLAGITHRANELVRLLTAITRTVKETSVR
jgi:four helix bundle protein